MNWLIITVYTIIKFDLLISMYILKNQIKLNLNSFEHLYIGYVKIRRQTTLLLYQIIQNNIFNNINCRTI